MAHDPPIPEVCREAADLVGSGLPRSFTLDSAPPPPDTTPPTTSITAPTEGATVSGTTTVTASASDNVSVTKVEFYLDGALTATDTTSPYSWSWNTTASTNAAHTVTSKAYDAALNVGTSTVINVTVNNLGDTTPPTTPANLTATAAKRKITLT